LFGLRKRKVVVVKIVLREMEIYPWTDVNRRKGGVRVFEKFLSKLKAPEAFSHDLPRASVIGPSAMLMPVMGLGTRPEIQSSRNERSGGFYLWCR
jgi:hypothetical protein